MITALANLTYGENTAQLFEALSQLDAISSVAGSGWQAVDGKLSKNEWAPGGFERLIRQLADQGRPYTGDAIIAIDEEKGAIAQDVIAALTKHGWRWLHANPSGRKVTLWMARTTAPESYYQLTGYTPSTEGAHLKHGAKRDRMSSPTNSPHQGSFVSWRESTSEMIFTPEGVETTATTLWLPNGESLKILAVPEEYDANDGDALLSRRAVELLSSACEVPASREEMLFLQFIIATADHGLKAMGQTEHNVQWPEGYGEFDILIGAKGILPHTRHKLTLGKMTARYPSRRARGLVFVDGMETVANAKSRYYTANTMVTYGRAASIAVLLEDQARACEIHEDPISVWHAEDIEMPEPSRRDIPDPWQSMNEAEAEFGRAVRNAFGSVFAHPAALGQTPRSVANRLRGVVKRNTTSRDGLEGMPAAVLPGAKLKLAHWFMAGVEEPAIGEINLGWAGDKPYTFSIAPEQWAGNPHQQASDGDDCDDEENLTAGAEEPGGPVTGVVVRTPSSPGGGEHFAMTKDADRWRDYNVVMPLREDWGKNPEGLWEKEPAFSMGPRVETQPPTMDLLEILAACEASAGQSKYIGMFADALQTMHMSGVPADEIAYRGSDLLDNVWNQEYDGQHIVREIYLACVERVRQGKPWFRPMYVRIASAINQLHNELYGRDASPVFGRYPEWEEMFTGVKRTNDVTDLIDLTLVGRCNGPVDELAQPVPDNVALIGAALVRGVQKAWKSWGRANNAISRRKGLKRKQKDEQIARLTAATLQQIQDLCDRAYEKATAGDYVPGHLTCAIRQASITLADRWNPPTSNRYAVPSSRRFLPKPEYKILPNLPLDETLAHYETGTNSDPSWLTRLMPSPNEPDLLPGDEVVVERTDTGEFQVRLLGTDQVVATLRTEGYGLTDLTAKFVGWVHQYPVVNAADAAFYGGRVAMFRTAHREVLNQLKAKAANAAKALRDLSY